MAVKSIKQRMIVFILGVCMLMLEGCSKTLEGDQYPYSGNGWWKSAVTF